jgi:hypothetical protein
MTHQRAALQTLPFGETIAKALSIAPKSERRIVQELGLRTPTGRALQLGRRALLFHECLGTMASACGHQPASLSF